MSWDTSAWAFVILSWLFGIMAKFILQVPHLIPKVTELNQWAYNTIYLPFMVVITLQTDLSSPRLDSFN